MNTRKPPWPWPNWTPLDPADCRDPDQAAAAVVRIIEHAVRYRPTRFWTDEEIGELVGVSASVVRSVEMNYILGLSDGKPGDSWWIKPKHLLRDPRRRGKLRRRRRSERWRGRR
jgi:hypothetical protein